MPLIAVAQNRRMNDYVESIRRAGGEPVEVVPGAETPEQILARVDGLMLTGGGDVDPALYGEVANTTFQAAEDGRDDFEIALSRAAVASGIPFLAICRGMQVLNVAMGGTLVQDIPSEVTGALDHAVPEPRARDRARSLGVKRIAAVDAARRSHGRRRDGARQQPPSPGREAGRAGLRDHRDVAGRCRGSDGASESPFCVAVQWHPENFWRTGEFRELFQGLVQAANNRKK